MTTWTTQRGQPEGGIEFSYFPLRDGGGRAWLATLALLLAGLAAGIAAGSQPMGALCCGVLLLAGWRNWLPVRFRLGDDGVRMDRLGRARRIPWRSIARLEVLPHGVLLYEDGDQSLFAPLRSCYVPFGRRRSEILARLMQHIRSLPGVPAQ